jgi:hypothetical protein
LSFSLALKIFILLFGIFESFCLDEPSPEQLHKKIAIEKKDILEIIFVLFYFSTYLYFITIGNQTAHPLAPFFKRIAYRKGRSAAVTGTARKLAVIIWNMITKNQPYLQYDTRTLTEQRKNAQVKNIKKRLFRLNLTETEMISLFKKTSFPVT